MAFSLDDSAVFAIRQQAAQLSIGRAITRIDDHVWRAVDEGKAAADEQTEVACVANIFPRSMSANHTGQRVAVGNADTGQPERVGL